MLGPGSTVDRYRLVAPAGEGGQGSVWRAEDPLEPGRVVALKLVPVNAASPSALERFRREAHTLAKLAHPSLPRCYALFEDLRHEVVGISLDFIEGSPLAVLLASPEFTREHRIWVLRHLAAALGYIHDAGLVHRDVKPQNVMVTKGFLEHPADPAGVKLVDFGIAAERNNPTPITVTGAVIGTNEFLAPEIIDRTFWQEQADGPERDVFALGVLAFLLLFGRHPAGLPADAPIGDFMLAYRKHADDARGWPPGVDPRDPMSPFLRASLALRSSARARNGAAMVDLLRVAVASDANAGRDPSIVFEPGRVSGFDPTADARVSRLTATSPEAVKRSNTMIGVVVGTGAALFMISFAISYARPFPSRAASAAASASAELAGFPGEPRPNEMEEPPDVAPAAASVSLVTPPAVANVSCPADMVAVAGTPAFCIDKHEVTVAAYRKGCAGCGPAKEAYWTGATATEAALKEQTANCSNTRSGLDNYPVNCVSYQDAASFCASLQKRLPRMSEWRAARSSVAICTEVGGVCPMFEWSQDGSGLQGYRATRGPSFRHTSSLEGSNIEVARNDDLGFRCAVDGTPASSRPR